DPDNRRAVDYDLRRNQLAALDTLSADALWQERDSGAVKLHVLRQGLALRAAHPQAFGAQGSYQGLNVSDSATERFIAFQRGGEVVTIISRWHLKHGGVTSAATLT